MAVVSGGLAAVSGLLVPQERTMPVFGVLLADMDGEIRTLAY